MVRRWPANSPCRAWADQGLVEGFKALVVDTEIRIAEPGNGAGLEGAGAFLGIELQVIDKAKQLAGGGGMQIAGALLHDQGARAGRNHPFQAGKGGFWIRYGPVGAGAMGAALAG